MVGIPTTIFIFNDNTNSVFPDSGSLAMSRVMTCRVPRLAKIYAMLDTYKRVEYKPNSATDTMRTIKTVATNPRS